MDSIKQVKKEDEIKELVKSQGASKWISLINLISKRQPISFTEILNISKYSKEPISRSLRYLVDKGLIVKTTKVTDSLTGSKEASYYTTPYSLIIFGEIDEEVSIKHLLKFEPFELALGTIIFSSFATMVTGYIYESIILSTTLIVWFPYWFYKILKRRRKRWKIM